MAKMIPDLTEEQIIVEHDSEAEARVYAALHEGLPADLTVLYSVPWIDTSGKSARDGEADFVVIDPSRGILVLEVKGGTTEIASGGRWLTRGPAGEIVPITNPFHQGVASKNVLRREIAAMPGVDTDHIVFGHGVVLPDMLWSPGNLGMDAPAEILVLGGDLDLIDEKIDSLFEFWSDGGEVGLEPVITDLIVDRIFPHQMLALPLGVEVRSAEERIIELTKQQCRYLGFLRDHRRVCIEGSAGTGKTVLAFEKAKQLATDGIPTLLTCFNNRLATQLEKAAENVPNLTVWTFHDTCIRYAREAGLDLPEDSAGYNSEFFDTELPDLMFQAIELLPDKRFGAVIVDEAQDLDSDWWQLLELLLDDDTGGWFWAFRDAGQNLYRRESKLPTRMETFLLEDNVRNTQMIHRASARYATGDPGNCIGPVGGDVRYELATNTRAVRTVVGRVLHQLINDEGLNREDVIVLTGSALPRSSVANVKRVGSFDLKSLDDESNGVNVESVWRFKGLECPVVIVIDLSESADDALRYVAMTRARSVLVMIGNREELEATGWQA